MSDYLKINRTKLNDELANQASLFGSAAEECELFHTKLSKLKLKMEILTDQYTSETRQKYRNLSAKLKPSETAIKALVGTRQEIKDLKAEYIDLSHNFRLAKVKVDALKMRAEMMVSMAHNVRQERKSSDKLTT